VTIGGLKKEFYRILLRAGINRNQFQGTEKKVLLQVLSKLLGNTGKYLGPTLVVPIQGPFQGGVDQGAPSVGGKKTLKGRLIMKGKSCHGQRIPKNRGPGKGSGVGRLNWAFIL